MDDEPIDEIINDFLEEIYLGQRRLSQEDIKRRAVAADLPARILTLIDAMPEGEYDLDEAAELLSDHTHDEVAGEEDPESLAAPDLSALEPEPDDGDFAVEHDSTAVSDDIVTGRDRGVREPEAPEGWGGLEPDRGKLH